MYRNDRGMNMEKMAAIFREEGDIETADAIEIQLIKGKSVKTSPARWKALRRADRLEKRGNKFDGLGDHDRAEPLYEEALTIRMRELGIGHIDTVFCANHLARCYFNNGNYLKALEIYEQIHRQCEIDYGVDDFLTREAGESIVRCKQRHKDAFGSWRLQKQMDKMMNKGDVDALEESAYADRAYAIAMKLMNRKQYEKAVGPFKFWLERKLPHCSGDDRGAFFSIWRYGKLLLAANQYEEAIRTFRSLVVVCNRHGTDASGISDLRKALYGLGSGLEQAGKLKAAATTLSLANKLEVRENLAALKSRTDRGM